MPLSDTVVRRHLHHRSIDIDGYRRDDGFWDIEAHLVDTKSYPIFLYDRGGELPPGEHLHDIWLRLTIDEEMLIHAVGVAIDNSPFTICPAIIGNFQCLVGVRICKGWRLLVKEKLGGINGCTHLLEMLGVVGTVAVQTMFGQRNEEEGILSPALIGSCHALAVDSPVVVAYQAELK